MTNTLERETALRWYEPLGARGQEKICLKHGILVFPIKSEETYLKI